MEIEREGKKTKWGRGREKVVVEMVVERGEKMSLKEGEGRKRRGRQKTR